MDRIPWFKRNYKLIEIFMFIDNIYCPIIYENEEHGKSVEMDSKLQ